MELPDFLKKYFWDVDFDALNTDKQHQFVIERILEYGDKASTEWLMDSFSKETIAKTLSERKGFSKKTANYWSLVLGVPKDKIKCLNKSYQQMQESHWPY